MKTCNQELKCWTLELQWVLSSEEKYDTFHCIWQPGKKIDRQRYLEEREEEQL